MAGWTEEYIDTTDPKDYPILYREIRSVLPNLSEEDSKKVLTLVVHTCPHCYENGDGCYCMRDD